MRKIISCLLVLATVGCVTERVEPQKSGEYASVQWTGEIDRDGVRKSIRKVLPIISKCYQTKLKSDPKASGQIVAEFIIGSEGKIQDSRISSSTIPESQKLGACILSGLQRTDYPKPQNGTATVSYPFVFHNSDEK